MSLKYGFCVLGMSALLSACFQNGEIKSGSKKLQSGSSSIVSGTGQPSSEGGPGNPSASSNPIAPVVSKNVLVRSSSGGVLEIGNAGSVCSGPMSSGQKDSECVHSANQGEKITLKAKAREGYVFTRWTGDCAAEALECQMVVHENQTVGAVFSERLPVRVKTADQIYEFMKSKAALADTAISGVPPTTPGGASPSIFAAFSTLRANLSTSNDPNGFSTQNQLALVRLASHICSAATSRTQDALGLFPMSVVNLSSPAATTLETAAKQMTLVNHLVDTVWGSSAEYEALPQGAEMSALKSEIQAYLMEVFNMLTNAQRTNASGLGTRQVARAGCIAVMSSAPALSI